MAATYSIQSHPRLSHAADALDPEILDFETEIAELQLGIAGTSYSGEDASRIRMALVLQVNDAVELGQHAAAARYLEAETRGPIKVEYRAIADARPINPTAAMIISRVVTGSTDEADQYEDMRSTRYPTTRSL